jgi:hypothetical protein
MQQPPPSHNAFHALDSGSPALPSIALPPVPFSRGTAAAATVDAVTAAPSAPASADSMPTGTSVNDLIGALSLDGLDITGMVAEAAPRPHQEFSVDVNRRAHRDRRSEQRTKPDRRSFTSEHLAAPDQGPTDPRPMLPPNAPAPTRAAPIDAVMPPLPLPLEQPLPLEPARAYELPNRAIATTTRRNLRPDLSTSALPFPQQAIDHPPQPAAAPEPPTGDSFTTALLEQAQQPAPDGASDIASIFNAAAPVPVGHLDPTVHATTQPTPTPAVELPQVAAAAAWFGGEVRADDALMIWNAPGTAAPLAPSVAAMIAPATQAPSAAPAALSTVATTRLAPTPAATAGAATGPTRSGRRIALLVALPAIAGIAVAVGIDRLLL